MSNERTIQKEVVKKLVSIIDRIYYLLEEKKWNQDSLAEKLGIPPAQVSEFLNYKRKNPTLDTIVKYEQVLESDLLISPDDYDVKLTEDKDKIGYLVGIMLKDASFKEKESWIEKWTGVKPFTLTLSSEEFVNILEESSAYSEVVDETVREKFELPTPIIDRMMSYKPWKDKGSRINSRIVYQQNLVPISSDVQPSY